MERRRRDPPPPPPPPRRPPRPPPGGPRPPPPPPPPPRRPPPRPAPRPRPAPPAAGGGWGAGTRRAGRALLGGVRIATQEGYAGFVFKSPPRGAPTRARAAFETARTAPPYYEDPSGRPLTIAGDPVL